MMTSPAREPFDWLRDPHTRHGGLRMISTAIRRRWLEGLSPELAERRRLLIEALFKLLDDPETKASTREQFQACKPMMVEMTEANMRLEFGKDCPDRRRRRRMEKTSGGGGLDCALTSMPRRKPPNRRGRPLKLTTPTVVRLTAAVLDGESFEAASKVASIGITGVNSGGLLTGRSDRYLIAPARWTQPAPDPPRWANGL
jgi:hypothetical protein